MTAGPPDLRGHPQARHVRKRPIPVTAAFATTPGTIRTLEGEVRHEVGDAVLTGCGGERWPVRRVAFLASYDPVPPLGRGEDGAYVKRPVTTLALHVSASLHVMAGRDAGTLHARPGDWLLQYPDGDYGVVSDDIFKATYEAA